jgi:hypothetical protein
MKMIAFTCLIICSFIIPGCASVYIVSPAPGNNLRTTAELMNDIGNKKVDVYILEDTVLTGTLISIVNDSTLLAPPNSEESLLISNELIHKITLKDPSHGALEGGIAGAVVGLLLFLAPEEEGWHIGTGLKGFMNIFIPSIGVGAVVGAGQGHSKEYIFHSELPASGDEANLK